RIMRSARFIPTLFADGGEIAEDCQQEPAKPHALADSANAQSIHAVIPIAATKKRKAVLSNFQAAIDGADAMLKEGSVFLRDFGLEVKIRFVAFNRLADQERNFLIQNFVIVHELHVLGNAVRHP